MPGIGCRRRRSRARLRACSVTAHALESLPPGAVVPSLNAHEHRRPESRRPRRCGRVFERMGSRPKRVALAIPDSVAKVSLLRFEKVPERAHDLDELIRWQVRKAAPFRVEDAQLTLRARACKARRRQHRVRRRAWRARTSFANTRRLRGSGRAGRRRRPDDVQRHQRGAGEPERAVRRLAARARGAGRRDDGHPARAASGVLPQPRRRRRSQPRRHGAPDGDVLRRSAQRIGISRGWCWPAAGSPTAQGGRTPTTCAGLSSSASASRSVDPPVDDHAATPTRSRRFSHAGTGGLTPCCEPIFQPGPFTTSAACTACSALTAVIVLALTIFNLTQIGAAHDASAELSRAGRRRRNTRRRSSARTPLKRARRVNTKQLEALSNAAREANAIIGQRLFSWTDLLNRLETTLPDDVRITALRPARRVATAASIVQMTVAGRSVDDIDNSFRTSKRRRPSAMCSPRRKTTTSDEGLVQAARGREVCDYPLGASSTRSAES